MAQFSVFPKGSLPAGFAYPEEYLRYAEGGEHPNIAPWWFVDAESKAGQLFWSVRGHDGRNLIPFAKVDDGRDDIACFDGDDATGQPRILMLVLDGSRREYAYADFKHWLEAACADARRFKSQ